jgi:septal ring factor EnvC (AmiA/AmiB activator)
MNEAFWLMWKLATPILAVAAVLLFVERRNLRQRISILEADVEDAQRKRRVLQTQLVALNRDAMSMHDHGVALHAQVEGLRERVAHLKQHNDQLTFDALVNSRGLYKFFVN